MNTPSSFQSSSPPGPQRDGPANISLMGLVELLHDDQTRYGPLRERPCVEEYLERFPHLRDSPDAVVALLYREYLLREQAGEQPNLDDFAARFPALAGLLRGLLEVRASVAGQLTASVRPPAGPPEASAAAATGVPVGQAPPEAAPVVDSDATHFSQVDPQATQQYQVRDAQHAPAAEGALRVPGYLVVSVLGKGGMGIVYKAEHVALHRTVALKMILHGDYADEADRQRFRLEAETIARLQHPHVVQVYEVGEHNGLPYFSLEFCSGGSLEKQINGTPWEPKRAAALVETLARAMHAAHQAGLVHRDLKPANILLTADGTPKITDFGLVKRLDVVGETATGAVMGTPSYMAPEQASGKSREVGPAADVYALGTILYELLTGRPPFRAPSVMETLGQVLNTEAVTVRRLQPKTPADIDTICLKCLEKQPGKRYASAAELADDLRRFLNQEPIQARPTGVVERAIKWVQRRPVIAALLAVVVLVTAGGIGAFAWAYGEALRKGKEASDRLTQVEAEQRQRVLAQVDQLRTAAAEAVPSILADLRKQPDEVLPRLRQLWQDKDQSERARMRVGLALVSATPGEVKGPLTAWMLKAPEPREVLLARDALQTGTAEENVELWRQVHNKETKAEVRFRALVALAAFDPSGAGWTTAGEAAVAQLLAANPLYLGTWTEALRPVSAALGRPLGEVFRGRKLAEHRLVAANVLAAYVGEDPKAVADLAADADVEQLVVLRPLLQSHAKKIVPLLEAELKPLTAAWQDAPLDPAWGQPEAKVVSEIERAGGMVRERFALCQTLPLDRVVAVVDAMQKSGYRPTRLRPYRGGGKVQVALVWTRDGIEMRRELGLSAAALMALDEELRKQGFVAIDVAAYGEAGDDTATCYACLWRRAGKEEEATLLPGLAEAGLLGSPWRDAHEEARKKGTIPVTVQSRARANDRPLFSGLRHKSAARGALRWTDNATIVRQVFPDRLPVDVDVGEAVGWGLSEWAGMVGWVAGQGQGGLTAVPWAVLGPVDHCWYATVWQDRPDRQAERILGLDIAAHAARMRELAAQGWRPAALSVAEVSQGWWRQSLLRTASVWHRPAVTEAERVARAPRQANAAAVLLHLGDAGPVWPLLKHTPTPDVRSHLLARLGTHGIDPRTIVVRLEAEQDAAVRRALIVGLGEFGDKELPEVERDRLLPLLLRWFRDDPDPGVHGAIDWLLRHGTDGPVARKLDWGKAKELERIDRERQGKEPGERRWYVNGQRHTYAMIPGPVDFLMGSPADEPQRSAENETQHRRRIGRSYAIAAKVVTVADFEQFLKESPKVTHGETSQYNPEPGCPRVGVSWFDGAQYCRWLSEKEGVPPEEMCYPSIEEIEKSKNGTTPLRLPPGYLKRTGYRLPTEAEWENACRNGVATAWSFGSSEDLLDRYGWYLKNSGDRTWPVGQKRPNELGLFDMQGNVFQWCQNIAWPYQEAGMEDKEDSEYDKDITDKFSRSFRGGAISEQSWALRAGDRLNNRPSNRNVGGGLRPARTCR